MGSWSSPLFCWREEEPRRVEGLTIQAFLTDCGSELSLEVHTDLLARPWVASQRPKSPKQILTIPAFGGVAFFLFQNICKFWRPVAGAATSCLQGKETDFTRSTNSPANSTIQIHSEGSLSHCRCHCVASFLLRENKVLKVSGLGLNAEFPLLSIAVSKTIKEPLSLSVFFPNSQTASRQAEFLSR